MIFITKCTISTLLKPVCIIVLEDANDTRAKAVAYLGFFFGGGGFQQIQLRTKDRQNRSWSSSPLVRGSGGSCSLVQEISFHIVKFS